MIRIALDLDDTVFDFLGAYRDVFPGEKNMQEAKITKNVLSLRKDKHFWENLPLLEMPNFEPCIYATKRINSKIYTRNCLTKYGLPVKPIYQIYSQAGNKATIIKGRCDVLVDDSAFNCYQAMRVGFPAILITRPHNVNSDYPYRINRLDLEEILEVYKQISCV
jgi:FMN phosphatase YigB (HAD superfamily)